MQAWRHGIFILPLLLAAMAVQADPAPVWHLGDIDSEGAWAYAEEVARPSQMRIATRLTRAHDSGDGTNTYYGLVLSEELDCATMRVRTVRKVFYEGNSTTYGSIDDPTDWQPTTDTGIDNVFTARCAGKPLPDKELSVTGDEVAVQKWLAGQLAARR